MSRSRRTILRGVCRERHRLAGKNLCIVVRERNGKRYEDHQCRTCNSSRSRRSYARRRRVEPSGEDSGGSDRGDRDKDPGTSHSAGGGGTSSPTGAASVLGVAVVFGAPVTFTVVSPFGVFGSSSSLAIGQGVSANACAKTA